jgi:hypothetical protein
MKEIIEAVMERLKTTVPELRWIDVNMGQMDSVTPPVDYPCALIDVSQIVYTPLKGGASKGVAQVDIELYFACRAPSNAAAPEPMRADAMAMFDVVKLVDENLQGLETDDFYPLERIRVRREKNYYPRPFCLSYECRTDILE